MKNNANLHKNTSLQDLKNEQWIDIPNYENRYQISNLGRVKSLSRYVNSKNKSNRLVKTRILKQSYCKGYLLVNPKINNKAKYLKVHQLVAIAFLNHKPKETKLVVNHINFDRSDNRLENLEIVTIRKNSDRKHLYSKSKYVGVTYNKRCKKWISRILFKKNRILLGYFKSEIEAHLYYQNALESIKQGTDIKTYRPNKKIRIKQYKSVYFCKRRIMYVSRILVDNKYKYCGQYKTKEEALKANLI
jgi:hypothetical protein